MAAMREELLGCQAEARRAVAVAQVEFEASEAACVEHVRVRDAIDGAVDELIAKVDLATAAYDSALESVAAGHGDPQHIAILADAQKEKVAAEAALKANRDADLAHCRACYVEVRRDEAVHVAPDLDRTRARCWDDLERAKEALRHVNAELAEAVIWAAKRADLNAALVDAGWKFERAFGEIVREARCSSVPATRSFRVAEYISRKRRMLAALDAAVSAMKVRPGWRVAGDEVVGTLLLDQTDLQATNVALAEGVVRAELSVTQIRAMMDIYAAIAARSAEHAQATDLCEQAAQKVLDAGGAYVWDAYDPRGAPFVPFGGQFCRLIAARDDKRFSKKGVFLTPISGKFPLVHAVVDSVVGPANIEIGQTLWSRYLAAEKCGKVSDAARKAVSVFGRAWEVLVAPLPATASIIAVGDQVRIEEQVLAHRDGATIEEPSLTGAGDAGCESRKLSDLYCALMEKRAEMDRASAFCEKAGPPVLGVGGAHARQPLDASVVEQWYFLGTRSQVQALQTTFSKLDATRITDDPQVFCAPVDPPELAQHLSLGQALYDRHLARTHAASAFAESVRAFSGAWEAIVGPLPKAEGFWGRTRLPDGPEAWSEMATCLDCGVPVFACIGPRCLACESKLPAADIEADSGYLADGEAGPDLEEPAQ